MSTDSERITFLQEAARHSPTGISIVHIPSVDGEPSGFRFMRKFRIDPAQSSIREAIDAAMKIGVST